MNHFFHTNRLRVTVFCRLSGAVMTGCLLSILSYGQFAGLTEKVSIKLKNTTAVAVIRELDKQSVYTFSYTQAQLEKITIPSFVYESTTLGKALQNLRAVADLEFKIAENIIAVKAADPKPMLPAAAQAKPGKITGVVRNDKNELMPGVSVMVENIKKGTSTFVSGDYVIVLPPGTYTVLVSFVGYTSRRITEVVVKENEVTDLNITLNQGDTKQLQAVVVTSGARRESVRALLLTQKNNAAITDGISAEQIRATPDNNTGQVLKRVSGLTVQNNKFVTIRGMSDRYNNVLINGATLPSTEPNRRNFSFDIVPSALVDNIVINKTATPDLPSEFTGGIVQINTKDVPAQNFLEVIVGSGFNTGSINRDFISHQRDEKAWWGKVDDNRQWFGHGKAFDPTTYQKSFVARDTAVLNKVARAIPNRWQLYKYPYTPVRNFQLAGGMNKSLSAGHAIGFVGAVTYRGEELMEEGPLRAIGQVDVHNQRYNYTSTIGALLNTAWKTSRHRISWKNLYNRRYSNQFNLQAGGFIRPDLYSRRHNEATLTNDLLQTRLEGEHVIGKIRLKADWYGDYTRMIREQPDTRFLAGQSILIRGIRNDSLYDVNVEQKGYAFNEPTLRFGGLHSSRLEENRKNAGANITLPFKAFGENQFFKTGISWSERRAGYDASNLVIMNGPNGTLYTASKTGYPYYEIVAPEAFLKGDLEYRAGYAKGETTGDRYAGVQALKAGYAMLDLHPLKMIRITGGWRYEANKIDLSTMFVDPDGNFIFEDTVYDEKDWLPSLNLTWHVNNTMNVRAAYSKTLSRPDFVERSPYIYFDFTELTAVVGQQKLTYSRINNYDFRFEYYPSGAEIFSASVFYKEFEKPVERFYNLGDASNTVEYRNLYSAIAKGFEIDMRKSLAFINPGARWLQQLYISGNFTYLKGSIRYEVEKSPVTGKDTSYIANDDRPIQGLSPYIINGGLMYQGKLWGFNIAYNRFGRRIVNGGNDPAIVQYENPRDVIDFQLTTRLMKQRMEIRVNIADILNQYFIIYSNSLARDGTLYPFSPSHGEADPKGDGFNEELDFINYKVKKGVGISFNVSYRF